MQLLQFLKYNNAFPIAISIMLLGAGGAFAASNPEAIYSTNQSVVSIDNTYIANKNLAAYSPRIQILGVSEDTDYYYVAYTFFTVDLKDYVWQDVQRGGEMKVSKAELGQYRDLGLYVTEQLKQIIDREAQRLAETQQIERKNVTQKKIATVYGGIVGKLLDVSTEELPGYTPVVTPPPPPPPPPFVPSPTPVSQVAATVAPEPVVASNPAPAPTPAPEPSPSGSTEPAVAPDPNAGVPTMQVIGDTVVNVPVGTTYTDLGASVTGPTQQDLALTIAVAVNGKTVASVNIDTSTTSDSVIRYSASNAYGTTAVERRVVVYVPTSSTVAPTTSTSTSSTTPTTNPPPAPADTTPPVITLKGEAHVTVTVGDGYQDAGATVTDNVDTNIQYTVSVDGGTFVNADQLPTVDTTKAGDHTITFSATDDTGNTGTAVRTVSVVDPPPPPAPEPAPAPAPEPVADPAPIPLETDPIPAP